MPDTEPGKEEAARFYRPVRPVRGWADCGGFDPLPEAAPGRRVPWDPNPG